MSTNRSKDRYSLCSFMFVDGHPYLCVFHAVSCSGGLQTRQRDGREHASSSSRGHRC
jgi:hypothetical protein